jgi:hypothetical protein
MNGELDIKKARQEAEPDRIELLKNPEMIPLGRVVTYINMARSSYIYIIQDSFSVVVAAFTVKHELESYIDDGNAPQRHTVIRVRDGRAEDYNPVVISNRLNRL